MKYWEVSINFGGLMLFGFLSAKNELEAIKKFDEEFPNFKGCLEEMKELTT